MTSFSSNQFDEAYPIGIEFHYWNFARNLYIAKLLARVNKNADILLEIGCGRGIVVEYLRSQGFSCFGCDLARPKIPEASKNYLFFGQNAVELPEHFRSSITTILLLDVIEHLEDPPLFLTKIRCAFPNLKTVYVTVPARPELWSNYDRYYGHHRRYTKKALLQDLNSACFQSKFCSYFFHSLYFPTRLLAALKIERPIVIRPPSVRGRVIHRLLAFFFFFEALFVPPFAYGSSLVAICQVNC